MTSRILPVEEYGKLAGTECEAIAPILPDGSRIVVVEDGDRIVGCWALYSQVHCEGVWIAPSHRGRASVARRLVVGMRSLAQAMGARAVNTASVSGEVSNMLRKLGAVQLDGEHFSLRVGR